MRSDVISNVGQMPSRPKDRLVRKYGHGLYLPGYLRSSVYIRASLAPYPSICPSTRLRLSIRPSVQCIFVGSFVPLLTRSRMFPDVPGCPRMSPDVPGCPRMSPDIPGCPLMSLLPSFHSHFHRSVFDFFTDASRRWVVSRGRRNASGLCQTRTIVSGNSASPRRVFRIGNRPGLFAPSNGRSIDS